MTHKPTSTIEFASLLVLFAFAATAAAQDFTFRVPVEVSRFAPGVTNVDLSVNCNVSRVLRPDGTMSFAEADVVARGITTVTLGPGPVNTMQVVTVTMNARNPRLLPASEGRGYTCVIGGVEFTFPEGDSISITTSPLSFGHNYETLTRHRLTTVVRQASGEIPH